MNIEKEIYGGRVKLKFVDSNHSYWISNKDGKGWSPWVRATGVTTIIGIKDKSGPLKYWVAKLMAKFLHGILAERPVTKYDVDEAKDLHTKFLKGAADIGSKIHDWIEEHAKGMNPEMPSEQAVVRGVNAFLGWEKETKIELVESEVAVYSLKYGYCGQVDAIGKIGKKLYLIDYKTGTGLYNDVMLQTAAYAKAYEEMTGKTIAGRWAVRIEKRSEEEFQANMDEKGKANEPYREIEAVYLENSMSDVDADFEAFLAFKKGREWDGASSKRMEALKQGGKRAQ